MCDDADDDIYTTIFIGIIDINTGIMTFTNAGHPYPLIIHHNGQTSFLNKYPDVPIGVLEEHEFSEHIYTFNKKYNLVIFIPMASPIRKISRDSSTVRIK